MDTDSFIYDIRTNDLCDDIRDDINYNFDTSTYPKQNVFDFPLLNKKVLGMMKDECNGKIIKEFIGLRSKLYSFKIGEDGKETKKIKGVKSCVTAKLSVDDFRKSKIHQLYTQHLIKLVLSYFGDKRFVRENVGYPTCSRTV
uniref:Uncharacterized protein n=1 Tax=Glossina morsitans morsitans TaxID=37546 RepID=A0A1B0FMV5_GLOMM